LSVTVGTQLGSYEITALLGKGGMGEVWRARDMKLKRDVAIKFLLDELSRDHDRVSRFQREAEVLASLSHTIIAAIYDFQDVDGSRFLVLELVDGETLAERIQRGPLPVNEALEIARSICEALEAAHEKGIVHRDLKPANIKITPEGKVNVLDFGLAKAYEREHANVSLSNSPTISMAATNAGLILGTAGYMSPEQASGKTVEKRSDLWAFGVVLIEMLTGHAVFQGETVSHILASVLKDEPDWSALPARTPAPILRLLRRCLEKDRKRRLADASDARLEIEEALAAPVPEAALAGAATRDASSRLAWIAFAAAVLVAAGLAWVHFRETPPAAPPEMRTEIITPASNADPGDFALSPDGRQIVFVASGDGPSRLWLRSLATTAAQPLARTEGAEYPFWSPDGRSVGFFADGKLKRLDIGGGAPQVLANVAAARGGTWNADGDILFTPGLAGPLFRVSASGGEAVPVTKLDQQTFHRFPQFLPDGRQFLFCAQGTPEKAGIYLGSLDSGEMKRLTAADTTGVYAPSGWLLWERGNTLVAQRLDLKREELAGDPVTVADPVGRGSGCAAAFSVSVTGLIAFQPDRASQRQL
jgi:eukaryotic-like serine/threonine-protein kinase